MKTHPYTRRSLAGITLIELLTVMVVIAILASIAVPSYRSYLLRANRSDAKSALMNLQVAQEKYFLQFNKYTDKVTDKPPAGLGLTDVTTHGYYKLTVPVIADDGQSYTAYATPIAGGGQSDDKKCNIFTINDRGTQAIKDGTGDKAACWK
jgi:type IV pilus assembly protein PilE